MRVLFLAAAAVLLCAGRVQAVACGSQGTCSSATCPSYTTLGPTGQPTPHTENVESTRIAARRLTAPRADKCVALNACMCDHRQLPRSVPLHYARTFSIDADHSGERVKLVAH